MASRFRLQVVNLDTGRVVEWAPGQQVERDLVTELCARVAAKGVGVGRSTAHVVEDVRTALQDLLRRPQDRRAVRAVGDDPRLWFQRVRSQLRLERRPVGVGGGNAAHRGGGGPITNDGTFAKETGGNLATLVARTPALGQALAAASTPVVLPAAQVTALTPPAAIAGFALEAGHLATIDANLALIKAKTDNLDAALSTRTKPADQQHTIIDARFSGRYILSSVGTVLDTGLNPTRGCRSGPDGRCSLLGSPKSARLMGKPLCCRRTLTWAPSSRAHGRGG
jgi:hypothetical protein